MEHKLLLYIMTGCPFCEKVLSYLRSEGKTHPVKDILEDDEEREKLCEIGGKSQVPCLLIDGKPLYEPDNIIEWLKAHHEEY